jgi:hypothetical protein
VRFLRAIICMVLVPLWAADVTGTWTGQWATPDGNGFSLTFHFKQDGSKLTGTVQGPQGDPIEITEGKVEGDKISFVVMVNGNGGMKITHDGAVAGDEIKLNSKVEGGDFPGGTIRLKREK